MDDHFSVMFIPISDSRYPYAKQELCLTLIDKGILVRVATSLLLIVIGNPLNGTPEAPGFMSAAARSHENLIP